jgi:hypothetical protein
VVRKEDLLLRYSLAHYCGSADMVATEEIQVGWTYAALPSRYFESISHCDDDC